MRNYSIFCDDAEGCSNFSEVHSFNNNHSALQYAHELARQNARVEVWCEGSLIARLYRYDRLTTVERAEADELARTAFLSADRERSSTDIILRRSATLKRVEPANIWNSLPSGGRESDSSFPSYLPVAWPLLQPKVPQQ